MISQLGVRVDCWLESRLGDSDALEMAPQKWNLALPRGLGVSSACHLVAVLAALAPLRLKILELAVLGQGGAKPSWKARPGDKMTSKGGALEPGTACCCVLLTAWSSSLNSLSWTSHLK